MRPRNPYVARMDQVRIARHGEAARITYVEPGGPQVHLTIGPRIADMSDEDILIAHNAVIRAQQELADSYIHVAEEVPPGQPQLEFFEPGQYWVPRGQVLRFVVTSRQEDGEWESEPAVEIDGREFTWEDFGKMLLTWEGWGVRMVMVPDDELEKPPIIKVRKPADMDEGPAV